MTPSAPSCPSCSARDVAAFFAIDRTPVTCATVFDTLAQAVAVPTSRVELTFCRSCGLVFNPWFDEDLANVGARYESSQSNSGHFSKFARSLSASWVQRYQLRGKTVLEIGCGHGDFLHLMAEDGIGKGIGLDPHVAPQSTAKAESIGGGNTQVVQLHARRFDATLAESSSHADADLVDADAVVCRHTLEHIGNLHGFLCGLAHWARQKPQRVVLLEVPATERILDGLAFWDVYYEHCNYFTAESLKHAFALAGFEVQRAECVYDGQYLILEATAARATPSGYELVRGASMHELALAAQWRRCEYFASQANASINHAVEGLRWLTSQGRPVVIWQGSSKTAGFLAALGQQTRVHSAVDLSPQRHGKFLPGSGLQVIAPETLPAIDPGSVVLMNPVYKAEVHQHLQQLGLCCRLLTVDQLLAGDMT